MKLDRQEVVSAGPVVGEIQSRGWIVDPADGSALAEFTQRVWVHRLRPVVELEIELTDIKSPEGDPWNNAFVSRFAWNDSTAAITRSLWHAAQPVGGERFESFDYLEIAEEQDRVTIIPHGLPFHRRTGPRMLDSLLIVEGETRRRFRFTLAVDQAYPLQAAREATIAPIVVPTTHGPPRTGRSGWFYHLDARNVQILKLADLSPAAEVPADDKVAPGLCMRIVETEGRTGQVRLQTFKTPSSARKRDFLGTTLNRLPVEGDAVLIDVSAYETAEVELRF
jgi:alpha-mannosidase